MARLSLNAIGKLADKDLTYADDFQRQLDDYIRNKANEEADHPVTRTFKPSSMICPRVMFYELRGVKPKPSLLSEGIVRIGQSGTDAHLRIQHWIMQMGRDGGEWEYYNVRRFVKSHHLDYLKILSHRDVEYKFHDSRINLTGSMDGILKNRKTGKYAIFEFKTEMQRKWDKRTGVDPKHYHQGIAYSIISGLDDVVFFYEGRDLLGHKAYVFHVTQAMRDNLLAEMAYVYDCARKGVIPRVCTCNENHIEQWCPYKDLCESGSIGEIDPRLLGVKDALPPLPDAPLLDEYRGKEWL